MGCRIVPLLAMTILYNVGLMNQTPTLLNCGFDESNPYILACGFDESSPYIRR